MKIKVIIFTVLSLFLFIFNSLGANKEVLGQNNKQFDSFFRAICAVESNNNRFAHNKSENARGVAQIRQKCLIDSNKFGNTKYTHNDCFNPEISKIVCFNYLARYKKSHNWELEGMARTWNGGGNHANSGPTAQKMLNNFWKKVKKQLDRQNKS